MSNSCINRFWHTKVKKHQDEITKLADPEFADRINQLSKNYWNTVRGKGKIKDRDPSLEYKHKYNL